MAFYGVELNAQINKLIGYIKLILNKNKYYPNFRTIYRSFINFDGQQTGLVNNQQLDKVLQQNGIFLKKYEVQAFEKGFAKDGKINWFGIMSMLREPMNCYRQDIVNEVFNFIDSNHVGQIHFNELSKLFNAQNFLEYKLKHKTKQRIEKQMFSLVPLTPDGYVTRQQFVNFYNDLSLNIPNDQTFAKFLCSQWGYQYQPKPKMSEQEVKEALRIVRFKLIQMTGGTHEEYVLKRVFDQFDVDRSETLNKEELYVMLVKLQMPTEKRLIDPLLQKLDKKKCGQVDYDEFKNFLFFDPYNI